MISFATRAIVSTNLALVFLTASGLAHADLNQDPCVRAHMERSQATMDPDFMNTDHARRVIAMCDLRDQLQAKYSLYNLKSERITFPDGTPFDSTAHLNHCIELEDQLTVDNSNLRFMDRVRQCIAGFQDTHMGVWAPITIPTVFAGFRLIQIEGKFYIAAYDPSTTDYISTALPDSADTLTKAMVVGNEVTEVDGKSPAQLTREMSSFEGGSSPDFVEYNATVAITLRDHSYPHSNSLDVKIKDAAGNSYHLKFPWWALMESMEGSRPDAMAHFKKVGILTNERLKVPQVSKDYPLWTEIPLELTGFSITKPLFDDTYNPLRTFTSGSNESTEAVVRVGQIASSSGPFCYLQLNSFRSATLKDQDGKTTPFAEALGKFLSDCDSKKLNLVLDLRNNPGGRLDLTATLMSLLAKPKTSLPTAVVGYRTTPEIGRMLSGLDFKTELPFEDLGTFEKNPLDVFAAAVTRGQAHTELIPSEAATPDKDSGGFSGKILALVTPFCISACDLSVSLLSKSGRATLLGSHSNGTGAGYEGNGSPSRKFTNTTDDFTVAIPNFMFGTPDTPPNAEHGLPFDQYKDSLLTENRPTFANIQYSTSLDDLDPKDLGKGWRTAVLNAVGDMNQTHDLGQDVQDIWNIIKKAVRKR